MHYDAFIPMASQRPEIFHPLADKKPASGVGEVGQSRCHARFGSWSQFARMLYAAGAACTVAAKELPLAGKTGGMFQSTHRCISAPPRPQLPAMNDWVTAAGLDIAKLGKVRQQK